MTVQLTDRLVWTWRSLGRSLRSSQHVRATLQVAALVGLIFGLFSVISGLNELTIWLISGLILGLIPGLIPGLNYGLISELISRLIPELRIGLSAGLSVGLSVGLSYWLLVGLFHGVSSETIGDQQRMAPNQGIRRSAFHGLVLGLISAMSVGLSVGLITGLSTWLRYGLITGLSTWLSAWLSNGLSYWLGVGLSAGLLVGLLWGGLACQRHYVLRTLLWRSGVIPWNYPHFLDFAAERLLLRKVGGGYIFLHRLLLDYFANLETKPSSDVSAENRRERFPAETVPSVEATGADERAAVPIVSLAPTSVPSELPRLFPCGHEWCPNARFCSICGVPVPS